jgi:hypothetical protein
MVTTRARGVDMNSAVKSGIPAPTYVAGIKYPSIFEAAIELGVSYNAAHKSIKKSEYGPCRIKKNIVVLESWVITRLDLMGYPA